MKCECGSAMIPIEATTVSGLGTNPREVKIRYECSNCGNKKDIVKIL